MPLLENLAEGFAGAAGATDAVNRIEKNKAHRQNLSDMALEDTVQAHVDVMKGLQTKLGLNPNDPELQKQLSSERDQLYQLLHSTEQTKPGLVQQLFRHVFRQGNPQQPANNLPSVAAMTAAAPQATADKWKNSGKPYQDPTSKQWLQPQVDASGAMRTTPMPEGYQPPTQVKTTTKLLNVKGKGWSFVTYETGEGGKVLKIMAGAAPPRSQVETARTSKTTDPFGVTSTSSGTTRPVYHKEVELTEGAAMPSETAAIADQAPEPGQESKPTPEVKPVPSERKKPAGEMKKELEGMVSKGKPQLDAQGHIPDTAKVNPNLRAAANNLMDGMDITKLPIPQKDRAAAEQLAKQYGWKGQGLFAPGDLMRVRNSLAIIDDFDKGDTLSVLDDAMSRQKIAQAIQNVEKRGMVGQALQTFVTQNLSDAEQRFVNVYLQAVGRISGLSQIVRSGRPTEATIERLKSELPNPAYAGSAAAARDKLALLHDEINIAMDKGQFSEQPLAGKKTGEMTDDEFLQKF